LRVDAPEPSPPLITQIIYDGGDDPAYFVGAGVLRREFGVYAGGLVRLGVLAAPNCLADLRPPIAMPQIIIRFLPLEGSCEVSCH